MRAGSHRPALAACASMLLLTAAASAHRRDEYLQAARIAIEADAVLVELDVTPGTDVAEAFLAGVDRDGDGDVSVVEQRGYAAQVIAGLALGFDGQPRRLQLLDVTFPERDAVREGEGTVRLRARVPVAEMSAGVHRVSFENAHLPDHSAYLANALAPELAGVAVVAQHRTADQRRLTIEYAIGTRGLSSGVPWLLASLAMAALVGLRARRR